MVAHTRFRRGHWLVCGLCLTPLLFAPAASLADQGAGQGRDLGAEWRELVDNSLNRSKLDPEALIAWCDGFLASARAPPNRFEVNVIPSNSRSFLGAAFELDSLAVRGRVRAFGVRERDPKVESFLQLFVEAPIDPQRRPESMVSLELEITRTDDGRLIVLGSVQRLLDEAERADLFSTGNPYPAGTEFRWGGDAELAVFRMLWYANGHETVSNSDERWDLALHDPEVIRRPVLALQRKVMERLERMLDALRYD